MKVTLTKKYRLIWQWYTLNIQNDFEKDYSGSSSVIVDNGRLGTFESDNYQDILDKIENVGLRPSDNWYIPGQEDI